MSATSTKKGRVAMVVVSMGLVAAALGAAITVPVAGASARSKAAVQVASVTGAGTALVNSGGQALYVFSPDKHHKSTCYKSCASAWPPLIVKHKPKAVDGLKRSLLGTVRRRGGKLQATYGHWPLYTFAGDTSPGQAHGQGLVAFGGTWSTIGTTAQAFGTAAASRAKKTTTTTTAGGGYGY